MSIHSALLLGLQEARQLAERLAAARRRAQRLAKAGCGRHELEANGHPPRSDSRVYGYLATAADLTAVDTVGIVTLPLWEVLSETALQAHWANAVRLAVA